MLNTLLAKWHFVWLLVWGTQQILELCRNLNKIKNRKWSQLHLSLQKYHSLHIVSYQNKPLYWNWTDSQSYSNTVNNKVDKENQANSMRWNLKKMGGSPLGDKNDSDLVENMKVDFLGKTRGLFPGHGVMKGKPLVRILKGSQRGRFRARAVMTCSSLEALFILEERVIYWWMCGGQPTAAWFCGPLGGRWPLITAAWGSVKRWRSLQRAAV